MVHPNTLPSLFLNVKLVTSHFFIAELSFKNSFSPYTTEAWYRLDLSIINSESLEVFKSKSLAAIRPVQRSIYNVFNLQGLKFLTLSLGLSHFNEHRFRHNFKDCINSLCSCSLEVENTLNFFLHCHHYSTFRMGLMNKVNQIDENFSYLSDDNKVSLLLYRDSRFDDNKKISSYQPQLLSRQKIFSTSLFQSDA